MIMNKKSALLCLLLPVSTLSFAGEGYSSFSELSFGIDAIGYQGGIPLC